MKKILISLCSVVLAVDAMTAYAYFHTTHAAPSVTYKTPEEQDVYVRFDMEVYDKIQQNYWDKFPDPDLSNHFLLSVQHALGTTTYTLASSTRSGVATMLMQALSGTTTPEGKRAEAVSIANVALQNLKPVLRSELMSQTQTKNLSNEVSNINPANDLYKDLGVDKGADKSAVDAAYKEKVAELKQSTSTDAAEKLEAVDYAHKVLADTYTKTNYDAAQIEPTVFWHVFGQTLYLNVTKIGSNTLHEFAYAVDQASTTPLSSMIIDFRGNIGGDLSFLQGFLGLFVGPGQYAFDLYHLGDFQVQRTTTPKFTELSRFRHIAILTDNMTQSTAELTTSTLKKFHLAYSVGSTSRGWGTVESIIPLETVIDPSTTYTMLLVTNITLREDNEPIESRGVTPDVDISSSNWRDALTQYFPSTLAATVARVVTAPPLK